MLMKSLWKRICMAEHWVLDLMELPLSYKWLLFVQVQGRATSTVRNAAVSE